MCWDLHMWKRWGALWPVSYPPVKWKLHPFSGLWGFFTPGCVYSQIRQEINLTAPEENGVVYMSVNVYRLLSKKDPGDGTLLKRPNLLRNAMIPDNSHQCHQPVTAIIKHSGYFKRELEAPHRIRGHNCSDGSVSLSWQQWQMSGPWLAFRDADGWLE